MSLKVVSVLEIINWLYNIFHGLYDKLSTNVQRQLGQYEKNPANMEKLSQYEIQPIRCEN